MNERRLKIAVTYLDKGTAIGRCGLELVKVFVKHADVTCYLTTKNKLNDDFKSIGCPVKIFPLNRGFKSLVKATFTGREDSGMTREIICDNPDLVLDLGTLNWFRIVSRMLGGRFPVVEIIHDSTPHPGFEYILYSLQRRLHPAKTDAIVSMSRFCHEDAKRRNPDKYHICSTHGAFTIPKRPTCEEIAKNRKNQLFFGRIEKYKGITELLSSYELAKQCVPDMKLTIAGAGKISGKNIKRAEALGVNLINRFVTEEELDVLMKTHGVMLMPYTSATQSGVVSVALANGMPCIATDVGALSEQVINGVTGIIVPKRDIYAFADAMCHMANDKALVHKMSEASIAACDNEFNWNTIGKKLIDDLEDFYDFYKDKNEKSGGFALGRT